MPKNAVTTFMTKGQEVLGSNICCNEAEYREGAE